MCVVILKFVNATACRWPMEYEEEDNGAAGSIPEFGAIFMSSTVTKKESFKRKIFALPSSKAGFVKHVKAGMVLFLFEYDKRQLFGVYQATSDGAVDIVPNGFNYSGRHFSAQVRFTPIWYCAPLSEKEFRGAIRENYFSANKFNFGLSEDQVRRLLYLYSSRKLKNKMPTHLLTEVVPGVAGMDRGLVGEDRFALSVRGYTEPAEYDEINPAVIWDYKVNSLTRAKKDELLIDDEVNAEGKVYPLTQEDFLAKRRRIDNDNRLVTDDVAENRIYNYGTLRNFRIDSPKDSLDEVRRLDDARRILTVEGICNENQVDKILNPVLSSEYLMGPLDVRAADDRFIQRNTFLHGFNVDNSSLQAFASGHSGMSLDKGKHAIDDDRLFFYDCVQREHNVRHVVKPMVYGDDNLNLNRQAREVMDDYQCSMNRKVENRYPLDYDGTPVSSSGHSANLLHKIRKTTTDGRFPVNDRIGNQPNFVTCSGEGFPSEKFSHPLHGGHWVIHDRKYPIVEGSVTENVTRNAGYITSVGGRVVDDGRFRKSGRLHNKEDIHAHFNPVISTDYSSFSERNQNNEEDIHAHINPVILTNYPSFSERNQNLSSLSDKLPEKGLSQLTVARDFDTPRLVLDNATITRDVPYKPEHLSFSLGCSASTVASQNSSLLQDNHPHHGSLGNIYSLSKNRSPQYFMESQQCSRSLDILPEFGDKVLPTNKSGQSSLLHEATGSFLNSDLPTRMDCNSAAPANNRGSLFLKPSLTSLPFNDRENIEGEKGFLFAYPSKSGHHLAYDGSLPPASHDVSERVPQMEMDMLAGKDFGVVVYHPERDLENYEYQHFRTSSNLNFKEHPKISEAPHFDSGFNRRSVFTRLTSGWVGEERNDSDLICQDSYMDATADQVMEMLQQGNNLSPRKLEMLQQGNNLSPRKPRKSRVVGRSKHGESAAGEKPIQSHIEVNHSTVEKKKLNDISLAIADSADEVPTETRIVDFKRRSETKKNLVGTSTGSAVDNKTTGVDGEVEGSPKTLKRRKLVRPVFTKTESGTDAIVSNQNLQPSGQILDKDDKRSCEKAISICEAEMPNDNTRLCIVLASHATQPMDCEIQEQSNPEEHKDTRALPSKSHELQGRYASNMLPRIGSSRVILQEKTHRKRFGVQSIEGTLTEDVDASVTSMNLEESSSESSRLDAGCVSTLLEEENTRMSKCKKKIIRTNKAHMEPSQ
ncbi:hypothetical protein CDL12_00508 [Handroanthus impetiginosus]|uniref:DCD domain-containing protein n=1 Tax=Handroanthus impetiginosus TaxID=429701 RepID=A0A2G9IAN9_9LAMI|nr:hypothetical protein CDL12_00508 [Handroanthus impetiginosus]